MARKNYRRASAPKRNEPKDKRDFKDLKSKTNDPMWYGANEALIRDSSSIPWSWALGTPVNLKNQLFNKNDTESFPGVCALQIMPAYGRSVNADSPMNVAATSFYGFIRHENSGHANYDAPDLMLYVMAMSQVYSAIVWLQRSYGLGTLYSQKNRYLPDVLLQAARMNASDVQRNMANFRYRINELINKAASFYVPNNMTIYNRHAFLYQNVYSEGDSIKDQMYMYSPAGFYKYTLDENGAGMLQYQVLNHDLTVDEACDFVSDMLVRLIYSEDINIMSGDILKACGSQGTVKLATLDTHYTITPIFDKAVLQQMKNATITFPNVNWDIKQDSTHAFLVQQLRQKSPNTQGTDYLAHIEAHRLLNLLENRVLSFDGADPTPFDTMEISRLAVAAVNYADSQGGAKIIDLIYGSDLVVDSYYYTLKESNSTHAITVGVDALQYSHAIDLASEDAILAMRKLVKLSAFKYHPCHHVFAAKKSTTDETRAVSTDIGLCYDVDNYSIVDAQTLEHMHNAALLNQFAVRNTAVTK